MTTSLRIELDYLRDIVRDIRETTTPSTRTGDQWRLIARESDIAKAESFERCDTDGFLSQWAHQQMQGRYLDMARIADDGGTVSRVALFDLDGNPVTMKTVSGRYGESWFIPQNEGRARFFNESEAASAKTRRRNNEKKGYRLGEVRVRVEMSEHDYQRTEDVVEVVSTDYLADEI